MTNYDLIRRHLLTLLKVLYNSDCNQWCLIEKVGFWKCHLSSRERCNPIQRSLGISQRIKFQIFLVGIRNEDPYLRIASRKFEISLVTLDKCIMVEIYHWSHVCNILKTFNNMIIIFASRIYHLHIAEIPSFRAAITCQNLQNVMRQKWFHTLFVPWLDHRIRSLVPLQSSEVIVPQEYSNLNVVRNLVTKHIISSRIFHSRFKFLLDLGGRIVYLITSLWQSLKVDIRVQINLTSYTPLLLLFQFKLNGISYYPEPWP